MTEQEKKMKKYCNAVERRLTLPREIKARVMTDFISSIAARREAGESDEEIFAELGSPREAAAMLNEQMKEYAYEKSPWRWLSLFVGIWGMLVFANNGVASFLARWLTETMNEQASIGIIGSADGPTAVFVTTAPSAGNLIWLLVGVMGLLGFWYLGRLKKK